MISSFDPGKWGRTLSLALIPGTLFMLTFTWLASTQIMGERFYTLFDDSMISMTYARTFASTGELVWYPGAARVQGITNPLWTFWMAFIHRIGFQGSGAALVVTLSGVVLILGCSVLSALIVRKLIGNLRHGNLIALTVGASIPFLYPLTFWTLRGMEVGLLALASIVLLWSALRVADIPGEFPSSRAAMGVALVTITLGIWTRLDFIVLCLVVGIWMLLNSIRRGKSVSFPIVFLISSIAIACSVLGFQYLYYGDFLPNTYYLKVEGFPVIERLTRGFVSSLKYLPLLFLVFWAYLTALNSSTKHSEVIRSAFHLLAALFIGIVFYGFWVGGDAWEWSMVASRYVSVGLPFVVIAVAVGAGVLASGPSYTVRRKQQIGSVLLFTVFSAVGAGFLTNPFEFDILRASILTTALAALMFLSMFVKRRSRLGSTRAKILAPVVPIFAVITIVTLLPLLRAVVYDHDVGPLVKLDAQITQQSKRLASNIQPDATVAVVWAGAPGYYLNGGVVDLLGKNDAFIARSHPHTDSTDTQFATLFPGHNKWDYAWSIGMLRPEIVYQLWVTTTKDLSNLQRWGYSRYCFPDQDQIWVRESPNLIDNDHLRPCPAP